VPILDATDIAEMQDPDIASNALAEIQFLRPWTFEIELML
jgi:hypothetical protein